MPWKIFVLDGLKKKKECCIELVGEALLKRKEIMTGRPPIMLLPSFEKKEGKLMMTKLICQDFFFSKKFDDDIVVSKKEYAPLI